MNSWSISNGPVTDTDMRSPKARVYFGNLHFTPDAQTFTFDRPFTLKRILFQSGVEQFNKDSILIVKCDDSIEHHFPMVALADSMKDGPPVRANKTMSLVVTKPNFSNRAQTRPDANGVQQPIPDWDYTFMAQIALVGVED